MAKLSSGQKRREKELKRKKKKQLQVKKQQANIVYMGTADGLPKLSERLIEFAGGMLDDPDGNQGFMETAVGFVVMCWNVGAFTAEKASEMRVTMEQALEENTGKLPEDIEAQIDLLITKRRFLYSDDPRVIVEYKVNWGLTSQYHIQVMSIVLPEDERFVPSVENASLAMSAKTRDRVLAFDTPLTGQEENLEQLIDDGFACIRAKTVAGVDSSVAACEVWLEAWGIIKALYDDRSALRDINNKLSAILYFWSTEMDMHLMNAALKEPSFEEKGITFLREFLEHFPTSDEGTHTSYRRAIAELQFRMGACEEGDATFEALTKDFPDYTWGYIDWGDIYNPTFPRSFYRNTPADIDRAKRLYRIPIVRELEDADDARERLEELLAYEREASTILDA